MKADAFGSVYKEFTLLAGEEGWNGSGGVGDVAAADGRGFGFDCREEKGGDLFGENRGRVADPDRACVRLGMLKDAEGIASEGRRNCWVLEPPAEEGGRRWEGDRAGWGRRGGMEKGKTIGSGVDAVVDCVNRRWRGVVAVIDGIAKLGRPEIDAE
jgi:hypothetical protein